MEDDSEAEGLPNEIWKQPRKPGIHIVAYADDFIVTCKTKEQAEQFVPVIAEWLAEHVGVELSLEKTRVTHIDDGFDFLGFHVRKYNGQLLIKPAKDSKLAVLRKIKGILDANKSAKPSMVIRLLNPHYPGMGQLLQYTGEQEGVRLLRPPNQPNAVEMGEKAAPQKGCRVDIPEVLYPTRK